MLIGLIERGRTREGIKIAACCTPHRVKGRPDTGAGGWVHQAVLGTDTLGKKIGVYRIKLTDVPDAIYSASEKADAIRQHITIPQEQQDWKKLREGRARVYAEFESSEGNCLEEFDARVHMVGWDQFEKVHGVREIPSDWTRYRSCDPAVKGVCAALCGAVDPDGDLHLYAEHYARNKTVGEHVEAILVMCGNTRKRYGQQRDMQGVNWPLYREAMSRQMFVASVADPRTFNTKSENGMLVGQMYNNFGVQVHPAAVSTPAEMLPIMNQWFARDPQRAHKYLKGKDGKPMMGAPKTYVIGAMRWFLMEAQSWTFNPNTMRPMDENDHLMACLRYIISCGPRYLGDKWVKEFRKTQAMGERETNVESHGGIIVGNPKVIDHGRRRFTGYG
jgi:hypothetical protein